MAPPTEPTAVEAAPPDPREAVQEFVNAIRRNLIRVIFTTSLFVMLGVALTMIWPNKYQSGTQFVLREAKIVTDAALLGELEDIPLSRKLQSLQQELKSNKRVQTVMDELQWTEWLQTAGQDSKRRALLKKIKSNLDVSMDADVSGGINVWLAFQWTTPEKAADFVNRMRDSWIKLVLESYRKGLELAKERQERVVLDREASYDSALAALQKYEQENDVPSLLDIETNNAMKAEFLVRVSEAKARLESTVTRIEVLRSVLQTLPREIEVEVPPDNPEQLAAMIAVDQAEQRFASVSQDYTEYNPRYINAKNELDAALKRLTDLGGQVEQKFATETNPEYFDKAQELEAVLEVERENRALVTTLEDELARVDANLERLPRVTMDRARLNTQVETAGLLLAESKMALQPIRERVAVLRNAAAAVTESTGLISTGPFEILELGIEPDSPVLPMAPIIMVMSLLLGVGFSLLGPVLGQFTRSSFGSVKEVSRSLGVPVLGAVDLILTTRDVRARSVQSVLTIATMSLVLLALGTTLYIYSSHPEVLPAAFLRAVRDMRMALT